MTGSHSSCSLSLQRLNSRQGHGSLGAAWQGVRQRVFGHIVNGRFQVCVTLFKKAVVVAEIPVLRDDLKKLVKDFMTAHPEFNTKFKIHLVLSHVFYHAMK